MTIDLDAIEAVARGATSSDIWHATWSLMKTHQHSRNDAHHIATMDPQTTLALVERVRELEAEVARQRARDKRSAEVAGL